MWLLDGAHLVIGSVHYLRKVCISEESVVCVCVHDDVIKWDLFLP